MIDTHCHLEYMDELVITEAQKRMQAVITSDPNPHTMEKTLEIGKKNKGFVFIAIGFHPEYQDKFTKEEIEMHIEKIRRHSSEIVSIGEIGLDYNWIRDMKGKEKSKEIFKRFIDLALELKKPITIHSRNGEGDAVSDVIDILKEKGVRNAMFHCFSGNEKNLKEIVDNGWYFSFSTIIVRSEKHQRLAREAPLENMMLDSDSPWLDPDSKELKNRPWKIERSAEIIAGKKGISKEEVIEVTAGNARKFFNLPISSNTLCS